MKIEIVEIEKPTHKDLNQQALQAPLVGDYWHEMFHPYFIIVQADPLANEYTVLSCLRREGEPRAYIDNNDGTWCFDYSKSFTVDWDWIKDNVCYKNVEGFVADVVRKEKYMSIVKEWQVHHAQRLVSELKKLGGTVSEILLKTEWV